MTTTRTTSRLVMAVLGAAVLATNVGANAIAKMDRPNPEPRSEGPAFVLGKHGLIRFDPPGVGAGEFIDVNDRGEVAGSSVHADGKNHGFLRDRRGRITRFDVPGAKQTFVAKMNDRGQIVGNFCPDAPCQDQRGFLREPGGRFRTIAVPGAVRTSVFGLDDRGRVAGEYTDRSGTTHGYMWNGHSVTTVDVPRAVATSVLGLNDRGELVGIYVKADGVIHAYHRDRRGHLTTIDSPDLPYTFAFDINDRGHIVGFTADTIPATDADELHGFLVDTRRDFVFRLIDVPKAPRTVAFGIDDHGRVAGFYENPNFSSPTDRADLPSSALLQP
jgi:hypothetical protein